MKLKIDRDGDKTVIILPDELISSVGWQAGDILRAQVDGDVLNLVRTETGALTIVDDLMDEYRGTLQALGKNEN